MDGQTPVGLWKVGFEAILSFVRRGVGWGVGFLEGRKEDVAWTSLWWLGEGEGEGGGLSWRWCWYCEMVR